MVIEEPARQEWLQLNSFGKNGEVVIEEIGTSVTRVARGVVYTYFQNIVGILTTLIYLPILVRILPLEEVGVTITLGLILALVLTLNSFSIPKAVTKFVAECLGRRQFGTVRLTTQNYQLFDIKFTPLYILLGVHHLHRCNKMAEIDQLRRFSLLQGHLS